MVITFQRSNRFPRLTTLPSLLATAILGAVALVPGYAWSDTPEPGRPIGSFAPILEKVIPAVVTIRVTDETYKPVEFLPRQSKSESTAAAQKDSFRAGGSGVIVDAGHGYILTNNHVIENATRIEVGLSDGRRMLAKLIGRDMADVAVVLTTFVDGRKAQRSLLATETVIGPIERVLPQDAGSISGAVVGDILPGNPLYGDIRGTQVLKVPGNIPLVRSVSGKATSSSALTA